MLAGNSVSLELRTGRRSWRPSSQFAATLSGATRRETSRERLCHRRFLGNLSEGTPAEERDWPIEDDADVGCRTVFDTSGGSDPIDAAVDEPNHGATADPASGLGGVNIYRASSEAEAAWMKLRDLADVKKRVQREMKPGKRPFCL